MTGHGRGEQAGDGVKATVELRSVNRKQAEIQLRMPREMEALEPRLRDAINQSVARGRVEATVALERPGSAAVTKVNRTLAAAYAAEFRALATELGLAGEVSIELLARCPGVIESGGATPEAESFWPVFGSARSRRRFRCSPSRASSPASEYSRRERAPRRRIRIPISTLCCAG